MEDRMFFVLSPEEPRPIGAFYQPMLRDAAKVTLSAISDACDKNIYTFGSITEVQETIKGMRARDIQRFFALVLYFAVDLRYATINSDCLKRAKDLVMYRNQAVEFLSPIEAENEQGRMQQEIMRELRQNKGKMNYRKLCQDINSSRFGSDRWRAGYYGLIKEERIADFTEKQPSGQMARMTALLRWD
jgi:hypothetical protein